MNKMLGATKRANFIFKVLLCYLSRREDSVTNILEFSFICESKVFKEN